MSISSLDCDFHTAITSTQLKVISRNIERHHNDTGDKLTCAFADVAGIMFVSMKYIV